MCEKQSDTIINGQYVIFRKKDYKKLHLLSEKHSSVFIGKDKVELDEILGKNIESTFKMIPKLGSNRCFTLQLCSLNDISSIRESFNVIGSGLDNRGICDDGSSQLLTSGSIEELRDSGITPKAIIEQLLENSKTFQIKTEYSQEKYIKKKQKKYFEFITVHRPTIRLLGDILYSRDSPRTIGIRIDTLSQITTALNFQPEGSYLLVENGFNGIVAATLLNSLVNEGKLIHMTPGNQNQKQAVLAMNFSDSHLNRLITVRLSTVIELLEKNSQPSQDNVLSNEESENSILTAEDCLDVILKDNSTCKHVDCKLNCEINSSHSLYTSTNDCKSQVCNDIDEEHKNSSTSNDARKRKFSNLGQCIPDSVLKKPRWAMEAELAVEVLLKKVDGLIIACKEYPSNILIKFLAYILPSRPFVIYSLYQEPLVTLYLQLKQRHDIVHLRITETWLRPYQVLVDRTHPAVTISSSSGFLLSGLKVINS